MGKPLTEEHKRKISEALKKHGGTQAESGRSNEAQGYLDRFTNDQVAYEDAKGQREALRAQAKKLGRKKTSRAARAKLNAQIKAITEKMKGLRKNMTSTKGEANNKRLQKNAGIAIAKAQAKVGQYNALLTKITDLMVRTDDPARQARLKARLERVVKGKGDQEARISEYTAIQNGKTPVKKSKTFNFNEYLDDRAFKPYRALTLQEERIDFVRLNEMLDTQTDQFEEEMSVASAAEIERLAKSMERKIDVWDIAAVAALAFLIRGVVKDHMRKAIGTFYGIGVGTAIKELGIQRPEIPTLDKRLMSLDSQDIAEAYVANLENTAKSTIKAGIAAGAATTAIVSAMQNKLKDEASKTIANISGTITGEYLNRGRSSVFQRNLAKIVAYQRSEVLDGKTCAMCLSLDELVVTPDDPMIRLEIVHTHCRGLWVPIFGADEKQPEVTGVPKAVTDRFDKIDGRPVINAFKNMKKPVNEISKKAQDQIRKRF